MTYKGSKKLLPEIARELGVDYVVEGSVARSGDTVRLRTQVIRADPETTLWSESFERPAEEVLALESSFTTALAAAINVQLSPNEQSRLADTATVEPGAYEAYLQGRFWAGKHSAENFRRAQGYFERAIAIDPSFAAAWAALASIHQKQGYFFEDLAPRLDRAESAVRRALELDPGSPDAHAAFGDLQQARWHWKEAESEIRRAIELEPGSAAGHLNYWRLLMRLRRFEEAEREIGLARTLDPLSANIVANHGFQLGLAKRYDEAFAAFTSALELDPDFTLVHTYAWFFNHRLERDPQRGEELREAIRSYGLEELVPDYDRELTAGGYPKALRWLALRLDGMPNDPRAKLGLVAGLLACAGESDRAMAWLERGYAARAWEMGWIATSPDFESLQDRADFRALVSRVGLPLPPA
jgi:Tfp pilus assembly protein PilF